MSTVNALPIESPNLFSLSGGGLTVSLALSGIDGKPHFSYQDAHQSQSFSGDEITLEETTLDTLASVHGHEKVALYYSRDFTVSFRSCLASSRSGSVCGYAK